MGQLAVSKGINHDVKQFAQNMIYDHIKLEDQMKTIAREIGVKVPDSPSKKEKVAMLKLQALDGDDFDKAYVKDMVKDHKIELNDFKTEAQNGSNPDVKQAAAQGSKVISQNLQAIQQIAEKDNLVASKQSHVTAT